MGNLRIGFLIVVIIAVFVCSPLSAYAALELRGTDNLGYRLIYDSDLNITWYDYTNASAYWDTQMNWAAALTVNFAGNVYDDWDLPGSDGCFGYCSGGDMGHLYYTELENASGGGLTNRGDFLNLLQGTYWYQDFDVVGTPMNFSFNNGMQRHNYYETDYLAIAVRYGDVATVVPEPISSILFVAGGTLLAGRKYVKGRKTA